MTSNTFHTLRPFRLPGRRTGVYHSLHVLQEAGLGPIDRLPVSLRILLEAVLRHCDGKKVTPEHVRQLAGWQPNAPRVHEIPFVVARILLQDLNGVPLLADLAAMRDAAEALGHDPRAIEPLAHVDMVIDHSVQVDHYGTPDALQRNMQLEFERNEERYRFMKWGQQAFEGLNVIAPGVGICHQVNLEHLATGVREEGGVYYPDTVVCPDSHTTMINGIGVLGWGVGGIEAEAGMLGQPVYFLTPDVTGVELTGRLAPGITATDVVLTVTERLRQEKVVGDFVEFFGEGAARLSVPTRATIANMAPEYGAFIGFFPMDEATMQYFEGTGRPADVLEAYMRAQGLFGMPMPGQIDYSRTIRIDLGAIVPSIAGPRRPQDRIDLQASGTQFDRLFSLPPSEGGFGQPAADIGRRVPVALDGSEVRGGGPAAVTLGHGDVVIAAITSCTNTSNPATMLAAGLLARKAVARGLRVQPHIKTSMAPGSRAVTHYLQTAKLLAPLEQLGFAVVAYGCTTCIGNSGPLHPAIEKALEDEHLVGCAVLSGNRNFEARIHGSIRANFLASPPLVVAFALAGRMNIDLTREPLGHGNDGRPVYLHDIWPSDLELGDALRQAAGVEAFQQAYGTQHGTGGWFTVEAPQGSQYAWPASTYLARPPYFQDFSLSAPPLPPLQGMRALAILGDSVTTDHISPAGEIRTHTPAGQYLAAHGIRPKDFNTYGARRGNHEVMMRGTFANLRIKNFMLPPQVDGSRAEGGNTLHQPGGEQVSIYEAAMRYQAAGIPSIVFGGQEYGTGSARDWAAKGTRLLGVGAVIVSSFERIIRSNLVLMGVLPLEFEGGASVSSLGLDGTESYAITGIDGATLRPQQAAQLVVHHADGSTRTAALRVRLDTPIEVEYYRHGGITPFVMREIFNSSGKSGSSGDHRNGRDNNTAAATTGP